MTERKQSDEPQETVMTMPPNMSISNSSRSSAGRNLFSGGAIPITDPSSIAQLTDTHTIMLEEYTLNVPMVHPKANFLQILREGGATGDYFTKKEVTFYLKEYIRNRQLYHPEQPSVVICEGDNLGDVFKVSKFVIPEAMKLIDANCYHLPDTCIKRKQHLVARPKTATRPIHTDSPVITTVAGSNSLSIQVCSPSPIISSTSGLQTSSQSGAIGTTSANKHGSKKGKYKVTGQPSTGDCSTSSGRRRQTSLSINISDTESSEYPWYFNVEMDTDTDTDNEGDNKNKEEVISVEVQSDRIAVEYDVASDKDDIISSTASISGISDNSVFIICGDSDMEFWADSSDGELSEDDKWSCVECYTQNSPLHGYCNKCWKMRPGWLAEKNEVRRKRRLERSDSKNREVLSSSDSSDTTQPQQKSLRRNSTISTELESEKEIVQEENDSGIGTLSSQQSSQESIIRSDTLKDNESLITNEINKVQKIDTYRTLLNYQSKDSAVDDKLIFDDKSLLTATQTCHSPIMNKSKNPENSKSGDTTELAAVPVQSNAEISLGTTSNADAGGHLGRREAVALPQDLCIVCSRRPKTASIIHGSTGHQVCCFRCARRLKRRGCPCPVCRRPIQKVIRNFLC